MNSREDVLEQLLIYAKVILAYDDRRSECDWENTLPGCITIWYDLI